MTDPLVEFLRARLGEDERVARAAWGPNWSVRLDEDTDTAGIRDSDTGVSVISGEVLEMLPDGRLWPADCMLTSTATHVALHDPARVFRGVEAKRKILEEHSPGFNGRGCQGCGNDQFGDYAVRDVNECLTLRALALEFSHHPDFREEWKP